MAGRRKKWLIAAGLFAAVAALTWVSLGRSGKMEVNLFFVGYTNYPTIFSNRLAGALVPTGNVYIAMVMATNSGNVAVELCPNIRLRQFPHNGRIAWQFLSGIPMPTGAKLPKILRPTETLVVEFDPRLLMRARGTELMAQRRGVWDRAYLKAWSKGGATVRRIMASRLSPPPTVWVPFGPITNPPPSTESVHGLITP